MMADAEPTKRAPYMLTVVVMFAMSFGHHGCGCGSANADSVTKSNDCN